MSNTTSSQQVILRRGARVRQGKLEYYVADACDDGEVWAVQDLDSLLVTNRTIYPEDVIQ